jgi:hypothetical protein
VSATVGWAARQNHSPGEGFSGFAQLHLAEHRSAFNKWCLIVGDAVLLTGTLVAVSPSRRKLGVALLAAGFSTGVAGHLRDENLTRALGDLIRHPVWTMRGDVMVARATLRGGPRADAKKMLPPASPDCP